MLRVRLRVRVLVRLCLGLELRVRVRVWVRVRVRVRIWVRVRIEKPRMCVCSFYCSSWDGVVSLLAFPAAENKSVSFVIGSCLATFLLP